MIVCKFRKTGNDECLLVLLFHSGRWHTNLLLIMITLRAQCTGDGESCCLLFSSTTYPSIMLQQLLQTLDGNGVSGCRQIS